MDETTFRILDLLASNLANLMSIRELTKQIKARYQKADYKNIYMKTQQLFQQGFILLAKNGQANAAQLNFENPLLFDQLSEMERKKKIDFFQKKPVFQEFPRKINQFSANRPRGFLKWILIPKPKKNAGLNKISLLFFLSTPQRENNDALQFEAETNAIYARMKILENRLNMKIDYLILDESRFEEILFTDEKNILGEMFYDKIILDNPINFWRQIANTLAKKPVKIQLEEFDPGKITEQQLAYNLYRFGYQEIGPKIESKNLLSIELTIAVLLFKKNARRIEAIPILLEKAFQKPASRKPNYDILFFLAKKYEEAPQLMALLEAYQTIKPRAETQKILETMKKLGIKPKKTSIKTIKEKMRQYHAI